MDSQVSMSREVSVFLLLVMVMHPYRWSLKVSMASSISAAIREVWSLELLQIISLCGWSRIDGSAAIYEP